mgnify:CR=1 FL=1
MNILQRIKTAAGILSGRTKAVKVGAALHDAAEKGRRLKHWSPTDADINSILSSSGADLLKRARDLTSSNPYAANAKEEFAAALIGTGIRPSSKLEDPDDRKELHELWEEWCLEADSEGQTSFYGIQQIAGGALFDAGEMFVRLRPRRPSDNLSVPLQLQLLESEYLDRAYTLGLSNGHQIKSGIEFNRIGRRVAYHFWREHPGDSLSVFRSGDRVRVPAEDVIHVYAVDRPGQIRGMPRLVPGMVRLYLLDQYDDAELDRKKVAALMAVFITSSDDFGEGNPLANETADVDEAGIANLDLEPGSVITLDPGEEVTVNNPADVGGSYEDFQYRNLLAIGAAVGVPYHILTGDVHRANYSSLRADLVKFRRKITMIQAKTVCFQLCRVVWNRWLEQAVLSGRLDMDDQATARRVTWIPPKWEWVDPLKDRKAEQLALQMGVKSRSAVIVEEGGDPEAVDQEIAADQKRAEKYGLHFETAADDMEPEEEDERKQETA